MTTRGKTTPASTGGSYAPHTGGRSRATLEDSAAFDELADTMQSWAGDYLTDDDIDGRLNDAAHAAVAALNGEPIEANADRTSGLYALNDSLSAWATANGYDPAAEGFDERLDNAVHAAAAILDPPPAPAPLSHWSEDCKEGPFAEVAGLNWKDRYGGRNLADTEAAVRIAAAHRNMRVMQTKWDDGVLLLDIQPDQDVPGHRERTDWICDWLAHAGVVAKPDGIWVAAIAVPRADAPQWGDMQPGDVVRWQHDVMGVNKLGVITGSRPHQLVGHDGTNVTWTDDPTTTDHTVVYTDGTIETHTSRNRDTGTQFVHPANLR